MSRLRRTATVAAIAVLCAPSARAQYVLDYASDGFCTGASELSLVDDAFLSGSPRCTAHLTGTEENREGAIWPRTPFAWTAVMRMETAFRVMIRDGDGVNGASGMTFAIQGEGDRELGSGRSGLGYEGISPSVAVELDTWDSDGTSDPDGNHVGIDLDGSVTSVATAPAPLELNGGESVWVWVTYSQAATQLEVFVGGTSTRPALPLHVWSTDLSRLGPDLYFGFTGASGEDHQNDHVVRSWLLVADDDSDGDGIMDFEDPCLGACDTAMLETGGTTGDTGGTASADTGTPPQEDTAVWVEDADGDGFDASVDCDDADDSVHPGAPEIDDDGIDQDCTGSDSVARFFGGTHACGCAASSRPSVIGSSLAWLVLLRRRVTREQAGTGRPPTPSAPAAAPPPTPDPTRRRRPA